MAEVAGPRSLRQLLDAVLTVGSDLDLPSMLERIVQSAGELELLHFLRTNQQLVLRKQHSREQ